MLLEERRSDRTPSVYVSGCNGAAPLTVSLGSSTVIGAMDWDGDGKADILVQNGSSIRLAGTRNLHASSAALMSIACSCSAICCQGWTALPPPSGHRCELLLFM
jgi:hypothetical protein